MQVRLDDDTAAVVAERKARDGGSLSKAANALLREYATGYPLGHAIFDQRAGIAAENAAEVDRLDDDRHEMTLRARCKHPLLRRVGDVCMACGSTIR